MRCLLAMPSESMLVWRKPEEIILPIQFADKHTMAPKEEREEWKQITAYFSHLKMKGWP